jgi:hypothetical protein
LVFGQFCLGVTRVNDEACGHQSVATRSGECLCGNSCGRKILKRAQPGGLIIACKHEASRGRHAWNGLAVTEFSQVNRKFQRSLRLRLRTVTRNRDLAFLAVGGWRWPAQVESGFAVLPDWLVRFQAGGVTGGLGKWHIGILHDPRPKPGG